MRKNRFTILLVILSIFFLCACTSVKEYKVTYVLNGEEYATSTFSKNDEIELEEIKEESGIVFFGWFEDEDCKTPFSGKIDKDTTLYGKYIQGYYRVNFVTGTNVKIDEKIIQKGSKITGLPTLENGDLQFLGWYRDENYKSYFDIEKDSVGATLTLYARWEEKEVRTLNIIFMSTSDDIWASKDNLYVDFYSYFYDFLKEHTNCDLTNISKEQFLKDGKTWSKNGKSDMYHFGDKYGRYYLTKQKDGTLEEQPTTTFLGYCYENGKFIDLIHHLEVFFAYWRTDEGYTGSSADPENVGNDFYIEPWAAMVDTAKFFFFTGSTLNTKYSWFKSDRVKDALDNIPKVLRGLEDYKAVWAEEFNLSDVKVEGYDLEFYLDKEMSVKIDKLNVAQTSCDECDEIYVYVKITRKA